MMRIISTGSKLPNRVVSNKELESVVETSDEWITTRTGIKERRISVGDTVASLASDAATIALEGANVDATEVQLIIVATCSPEYALPCCACQVQANIGAVNAVAFDLNAACAGFLFALHTAHAYINSGIYQNAIIIGAEVLSKMLDWEDRSTCVLFGDGAGAVFVQSDETEKGLLSMYQMSDGSKGMVLSCKERTLQNPFVNSISEKGYVEMNGQEVYKFATRQVPVSIKQAVSDAGMQMEDIDLFILHQANIRIIEVVAKRLGVSMDKFPVNLHNTGNISSATIPILLDEVCRAGKIKSGMKIVLSGFGAGLTYGACVIDW